MKPDLTLKRPMPWKYYVFETCFRAMGLHSLLALLSVIFWFVCGTESGRHLYAHWGSIGFILGLLSGFIVSSVFTWVLSGKATGRSRDSISGENKKQG
jgi:hypothetical protein